MQLDLLSVSQAAAVIGVTPARVGRFIKSGRLKTEVVDGRHILLKEEVERFASIPRPPGKPPKKF